MKKLNDMTPEELEANGYMRPDKLAEALGVTGRKLRQHLRETYPRPLSEKGTPWYLNKEQIKEVIEYFQVTKQLIEEAIDNQCIVEDLDAPPSENVVYEKNVTKWEKGLKILQPIQVILLLVILIILIKNSL
tara:strand:+ start:350 stop:745 length:396 start_codon:yes stop_codon:yes gene_type:complete